MPQQIASSVENNFTKGYITESTGLNFPENAATDTDNCLYTTIGDVKRRLGIDFEDNFAIAGIDRAGKAINTYKWNNAGGDGESQLMVVQAGGTLYFYNVAASTNTIPISQYILSSTVDITQFSTTTDIYAVLQHECQFSDGNGFLFVLHKYCSPFYVSYNPVTQAISTSPIVIKIRDFVGTKETPVTEVNNRPSVLNNDHKYNLLNQGWTSGSGYKSGLSVTDNPNVGLGAKVFTMASTGLGFVVGDIVNIGTTSNKFVGGLLIPAGTSVMGGTVTGYSGVTLNVNVTEIYSDVAGANIGPYSIVSSGAGYIDTWYTAASNYPSNADVWWYFKNSSDVFAPGTTLANVTLPSGPAPKGHFLLNAFNQTRSLATGIPGLTDVVTSSNPTNGCWFQGRVWYTGVDGSQAAGGTSDFYTWTSNIYFSQVVNTPEDFGKCYQTNDPTSQNLFDLLPTDGGVITIPEAGSIYKLFPIQNGMLIFAANGVWFLTGSRGIGFAANDYTITKISAVTIISGASFVDVDGLPYFWNEDGIYNVIQQQGGGLAVTSITVSTIDSFYDEIPMSGKKLARGSYNPIDFTIQWIYKDTEAVDTTDAYAFNRILNYNTYSKAFFPYSVSIDVCSINGINFVSGPGGLDTPDPAFRYLVSLPSNVAMTWAYERDENYYDWSSSATPKNYTSYFITGYKLRGQAIRKFQPQYVQVYRRVDGGPSAYKIQGIWDYAADPNSGMWSTVQVVDTGLSRFNTLYKRHKIRGRGYALQLKISSVDGKPFDIQGWAIVDTVNQST